MRCASLPERGEEHEGPLGMTAVAHIVFGPRDFLEAAAEMYGGRARTVR